MTKLRAIYFDGGLLLTETSTDSRRAPRSVKGVSSQTENALRNFEGVFRNEIEEYLETDNSRTFLTFLIGKGTVGDMQSSVLSFVKEWEDRGVKIAH